MLIERLLIKFIVIYKFMKENRKLKKYMNNLENVKKI